MWKYSYWKQIWFILITQRQLEYEENLMHLLLGKQETIFMDTNRNQDSGSCEKTRKNFKIRGCILSFTNYIVKSTIWNKAWLCICLFIWLFILFNYVQLQSLILEVLRYTITVAFKHQNRLQTTVVESTCIFLIIQSDSIENFKAKFRVKSTACMIEQVPSNCGIAECYGKKQTVVSLM